MRGGGVGMICGGRWVFVRTPPYGGGDGRQVRGVNGLVVVYPFFLTSFLFLWAFDDESDWGLHF